MPTAETTYLFRHAAYRDVAYGLQPPSERAGLHLYALRIMEVEFASALELCAHELAAHAHAARLDASVEEGQGLDVAEARYLQMAVQRAARRAQWSDLVGFARSLLDCPGATMAQQLIAARKRADALRIMGRIPETLEALEEWLAIAKSAKDISEQAWAKLGLATIFHRRGQLDTAQSCVDEAARLASELTDTALLVQVWSARAHVSNDYAAVGEALEKSRKLAAGLEPDDSTRLQAEGNWANHLGAIGRRKEAIEALARVADDYEQRGEGQFVAVARANLGHQLMLDKRDHEAEEQLNRSIEVARELGVQRTEAFARASLASLLLYRGALDGAGENICLASEIAKEHELLLYHAAYRCTEAVWQLLIGHERLAQEIIESARAEFLLGDGEVFIPEYCGLPRLRIAASSACTMPLPGRQTSRLKLEPPSSQWLKTMQAILGEMRATYEKQQVKSGTVLELALRDGEALVAEVEAAFRESRPALVLRGHVVTEMSKGLRSTLTGLLSGTEYGLIEKYHPALMHALTRA